MKYMRVYDTFCNFIMDHGDSLSYPLDIVQIEKLINRLGATLCSYEEKHLKDMGLLEDSYFQDGFIIHQDGTSMISYNKDKPDTRILFTLCHEIGHLLMKHKQDVSKDVKEHQEKEANILARNILCPLPTLFWLTDNYYWVEKEAIAMLFDVSEEFAGNRLSQIAMKDDGTHVQVYNKKIRVNFDENVLSMLRRTERYYQQAQ